LKKFNPAEPRKSPEGAKPTKLSPVSADPWSELRQYTDARIGLGRCGVSQPVAQWLAFRLAHARARDAVFADFDKSSLLAAFAGRGIDCLSLTSAATDKNEFLTRPDKGRCLAPASRLLLQEYSENNHKDKAKNKADVALVISDGLSANAIHESAFAFALAFLGYLRKAGLKAAPVVLVENGRVAIADEIAELLGARLTVILLGERPGLSSPNSLGVYMTYAPKTGCTDEARNCISNVRPGGLGIDEAVRKLCYLAQNAFERQYSGVRLKDDTPADYLPFNPALE
jgi:ethanolamine ammonia-lyase small subunit